MKTKITRRDVGRLLVATPLALSLPSALTGAQAPAKAPARPSPPSASGMTARQHRKLAKVEESYEKAAAAVRRMKVPIGTEPAFTFRPLVKK